MPSYLDEARRVLSAESEAVAGLIDNLTEDFDKAVELVFNCSGRVIVTGMGKSGLIGKKIAATLASTGTPSVFLHAAEGLHGDLGVISASDIVVAISYSGETEELLSLFPFFREFRVQVIGISGKPGSSLARVSNAFLNVSVEGEACPLGITPTSSSTATLAMGDALAMALIKRRNFRKEDFARRHPGGSLGRQLLLNVGDLMHRGEEIPRISDKASLREALYEISAKRQGFTTVTEDSGRLLGIITDGDLRRYFESGKSSVAVPASEVMTGNPKTIEPDSLAIDALRLMEEFAITALVITNREGLVEGAIHIHDILRKGLQ